MHARRNLLDGVNGRIPAEERIAPFRAPIVSAALKEQRNRARQMRMFLWDKSRARIGIDPLREMVTLAKAAHTISHAVAMRRWHGCIHGASRLWQAHRG